MFEYSQAASGSAVSGDILIRILLAKKLTMEAIQYDMSAEDNCKKNARRVELYLT